MTTGTRMLVFDGPHKFHVEEGPRPQAGPGEVRLRVAYTGICGSDLHGYTGESGRRVAGMIMGHEASGWVEEIGSGVEHLEIGEPVTFNPVLPCAGECGHTIENRCARVQLIGVTPQIPGAFADAVVVPASRVVPLGALDLEQGAVVEPLAVALHAVQQAGVTKGDDVLVIGGGMIGHCIAQTARLLGAGTVTVSEGSAHRRGLAESTGFKAITPEQVVELSPFSRVLDAVGISATASASIRAVARGGTVCFVGLGTPEVTIPLFEVVTAERSIVGTFCYTDQVFLDTVRHLEEGGLDARPYLGATEPLEKVAEAFEGLAVGGRPELKIMMATGAVRP